MSGMEEQDMEQNEPELEKSTSPILCNKSTRKFLLSRKMLKKSRVKLTDRFSEKKSQCSETSNAQVDQSLPSVSSQSSYDSEEQVEKVENVISNNASKRNECVGFQTAGGKHLNISEAVIKNSRQLFDDILNPGNQTVNNNRTNKYAFLSKKSEQNYNVFQAEENKLELLENIGEFSNKPHFSVQKKSSEGSDLIGFKTASGKGIQISDSAYNSACKKFNDEINENKFDSAKINNANNLDVKELDFLSTQETNELLSDFPIIDNPYEKKIIIKSDNFKGFDINQIQESLKIAQEYRTALSKFSENMKIQSINETLYKSSSSLFLKSTFKSMEKQSKLSEKNVGFTTAFGNKINISKSALNKAQQSFNELNYDSPPVKAIIHKVSSVGFSMASGRKINIKDSALNIAKSKFSDEFNDFCTNKNLDFQNLEIQQEISHLKSHINEFDNSFECNGSEQDDKIVALNNFKGSVDRYIEENEQKAEEFEFMERFNDEEKTLTPTFNISNRLSLRELNQNTGSTFNNGFATASGNKLVVSETAMKKGQEMFKALEQNSVDVSLDKFSKISNENKSTSFQTAAGNSCKLSESALSKAEQLYQNVDTELSQKCSTTSTVYENVSFDENTSDVKTKSNNSLLRKKKRLGVSYCKQISIPKHKMERAIQLFADENPVAISPIRTNTPGIYNSTPLKNSAFREIDTDITPIRNVGRKRKIQELEDVEESKDDRVLIRECTKGGIDMLNRALEDKRKNLELQLKIILEKQKVLSQQKFDLENKLSKRGNGILFEKKQNTERIPLQNFVKPAYLTRKHRNITPQNAELVHFNYTTQNISVVTTLDGASLVPNANNYIGLTEIEIAFKVMPGVDPKLIPNGWIRNHFKWIVWKLASYENFTTNMKDSLSLEHVIQQLKYRYDREVDKAQRPTLRKIYEMDDAPQKRMVLCVSNIFNLQNDKYELELTDGWYCIRTCIDEALCQQIIKRKIVIGTKLITCCAELLNCEGCHPLQAPDVIRLKINCNSTRRARWYVKLGYQKCPQPFPVKLNSVLPNGGIIGCIKFFVARVYPVKYMERQNKLTVWRNRKAEELRAQEWENKGRQDMQKIREAITRDFENSIKNNRQKINLNFSDPEITKITCPETLFNLYQNYKDPERLQELLSSSQRAAIMDYQQNSYLKQQQEISRKLENNMDKREIPKRDVTPVLQLVVIDVLDSYEKTCVFHIWKPTDLDSEIIKESSIFWAYNVASKKNGDLSTISRTRFQIVNEEVSPEFNKYKRSVLSISQMLQLVNKPLFNEFDTVGIIIATTIYTFSQSLWLADEFGRLLFIKIFESPKNCSLLDKLKPGQIVAALNLIFCKTNSEFAEAIANHLTIISCYPQAKHLQEGIDSLMKQLPKDTTMFLEECNQKMLYCIDKIDITKDCINRSSSLAQSKTLMPSDIFDESSDILYSMIDVDKFK